MIRTTHANNRDNNDQTAITEPALPRNQLVPSASTKLAGQVIVVQRAGRFFNCSRGHVCGSQSVVSLFRGEGWGSALCEIIKFAQRSHTHRLRVLKSPLQSPFSAGFQTRRDSVRWGRCVTSALLTVVQCLNQFLHERAQLRGITLAGHGNTQFPPIPIGVSHTRLRGLGYASGGFWSTFDARR